MPKAVVEKSALRLRSEVVFAWKTTGLEIGRGDLLDPFCPVEAEWCVDFFTPRFPGRSSGLQWALPLSQSPPSTRGNRGLASQGDRPNWLSKAQYLAFTSLRDYPLQQLRKLCGALHDRLLPLHRPEVRILVRQLLHHVGPPASG